MLLYPVMSRYEYGAPSTVFNKPMADSASASDPKPGEAARAKRSLGNILAWIVIVLCAIATLVWTLWAMRQPAGHTMWAPE